MSALPTRFGIFAVADSAGFGITLTYRFAQQLSSEICRGSLWLVPMRSRQCVGVLLDFCAEPSFACREVNTRVPYFDVFPETCIRLAMWLARYYCAPVGRAIRMLAPGFLWNPSTIDARARRFARSWLFDSETGSLLEPRKKGVRGERVRSDDGCPLAPLDLSDEQLAAVEAILSRPSGVTLLHGVTGSGKTEVYLAAAQKVMDSGKGVLVLVPEIALTPQMTGRFRLRFGENLAVFHSMLTPVEYEREWFRVHRGLARIVLGVRTAVFAPLAQVGLVIIDEEHDSSYKAEESPSYQARDVAVMRAHMEEARCVLGSATPSLESWHNVHRGRYVLAKLERRHSGLPTQTHLIDAREYVKLSCFRKAKPQMLKSSLVRFEGSVLSEPVVRLIEENYRKGEQSIVILNRRGFTNFGLCTGCGESLSCPNCSVTTTLHGRGKREVCHYCGFSVETRTSCPACNRVGHIVGMGAGTQNIEEEIAQAVPGLRVERLDRDVLTSNTRLAGILDSFRSGEVNCLVGTQLLSKGHDFPRVTLVVILHVEDGLFLPDFRAAERTFQLIVQASGRAGRGTLPGVVAIQSLVPPGPVVEMAERLDVEGFVRRELGIRQLSWQPPYTRQILIEFSCAKEDTVDRLSQIARDEIIGHWRERGFAPETVRITGPHPAAIERINSISRKQILLSSERRVMPWDLLPEGFIEDKKYGRSMRIDVDPFSFL